MAAHGSTSSTAEESPHAQYHHRGLAGRGTDPRVSETPALRPPLKDIVMLACAIVGPIVVVGNALRADGGRDKQIDDNTRRIVILEEANQAKTDLLTKIDGRTIRIETKLEMMTPALTKGPTP